MKDEDKPLVVFRHEKLRREARVFAERVGTDDIRSQARTTVDNKEVRYRAKAGNPELATIEEDGPLFPTKAIEYRGFVTKPTWFYVNGETPIYTLPFISLNHYGGDPAAWYIKTKNYKHGVSTGYAVGTMRQPTFATPVTDKSFYDVAYVYGGKLFVNGTSVKLDVASASGVPYIFPTVSDKQYAVNPGVSDVDGRNFHLFSISMTQVKHQRGDEPTISASHAFDIYPYLPITSTPLAASFGIDSSTDKAYLFGVSTVLSGQSIGDIYFYGVEVALSRYDPYITPETVQVDMVQMVVFNDLNIGAAIGSGSSTPSLPSFASGQAEGFDVLECDPTEVLSSNVYNTVWRGNYALSSRQSGTLAPSGGSVAGWATLENSMSNTRTVRVFTQTGDVEMVQVFSSSTDFRYEYSNGTIDVLHNGGYTSDYVYDGDVCLTGENDSWPAGWGGVNGPGLQAGGILGTRGGWDEKKYSSTGASEISHILDDVEMYYFNATCSYSTSEHTHNYNYNYVMNYDSVLASDVEITELTRCGKRFGVTRFIIPIGQASFITSYSTRAESKPLRKDRIENSIARCRDYIYHDKINNVAIYVQFEGGGTQSSSYSTIDLVVVARGVSHTVNLFSMSSATKHGVSCDQQLNPSLSQTYQADWPDFIHSPSIYAPKCEQGDFPYIAYTTAAEEAAGVAPRFTLSLPLFVLRHNLTINPSPEPPSAAYGFVAYNLTNAVRIAADGVWDKLESTVFHIHVSHDGKRDWLTDLKATENGVLTNHVKGDSEHHFAECYRT